MTETADDPRPDLSTDTIRLLTTATTTPHTNGQTRNFADFLAHALAATAANVGGPDRLLASRPGSWEAALINSLIDGTIGDDQIDRSTRTTEPLVVPLNVAELVETHPDHDGLLGLDDAIDGIYDRHAAEDVEGRPLDNNLGALAADLDEIITRYRVEYQLYADDFTAAIHREAQTLGIPWTITVHADTDPASPWWEPAGVHNPASLHADADPIAAELWDIAHTAIPLPNVDIRIHGAGA